MATRLGGGSLVGTALIPSPASAPVDITTPAKASQQMSTLTALNESKSSLTLLSLLGGIIDTLHHCSSTGGRLAQPCFVPRQGLAQPELDVVGRIETEQSARLADISLRVTDIARPEFFV